MTKWLLVALALVVWAASPAQSAFQTGTGICETTVTTGTGTVNLAGAYTAGGMTYLGFATQITSTNSVPYTLESSDGKFEHGTGVFTDSSPDTLTRDASWSSNGSGAELTLPAGTHIVCLQIGPETFGAVESDYWAGTDTARAIAVKEIWDASAYVTLTSSSNATAVNLGAGINFSLALGENTTLSAPSGEKVGQSGLIKVTATGSTRTVALNAEWTPVGGIETFPISVATTDTVYLSYWVESTSLTRITAVFRMSGAVGAHVGQFFWFTQDTCPATALEADGSAVTRTTYAGLWTLVQAGGNLAASEGAKLDGEYGPGNGTTTFTLPNLTTDVRFIRASTTAVGAEQASDNLLHGHPYRRTTHASADNVSGPFALDHLTSTTTLIPAFTGTPNGNVSGQSLGGSGGAEARPVNVSFLPCINY